MIYFYDLTIYFYFYFYYESTKRKLKTKCICGCRCYERLQTKTKEFTRLSYTELVLDLEHLKIKTRLITEMFANVFYLLIYYESTKRKLKTEYICGCRCYERLQTKTKEFTRLSYTKLVLELEHLKIETRLITEMFANVMGECEN
jgi:predicted mannosyl-3-phosphoglycerate phosphatase (HAD superfamily)